MVSSAIFLHIIVYGIIAAVVLPAVELAFFLVRESRRSGREPFALTPSGSDTDASGEQAPSRPAERHAAAAPSSTTGADRAVRRTEPACYVSSNGITITPHLGAELRRPGGAPPPVDRVPAYSAHPHAEYWRYGDLRFYEGA